MAFSLTESIDNLYTSTWRASRAVVADNIFDHTPYLFWLRQKGKLRSLPGGRRIDENLEYANSSTAAWLVKGQALPMNDSEILTTGQFNWRQLAGSVTRFLQDDLANRGRFAIINQVRAKLSNVRMDLEDTLETALFAGSGAATNSMDGLQHLVSDIAAYTTAVGNILPSTNSWWRNKTTSMTGESFATFGVKRMRTMFNDVSKSKGSRANPDLILTGQTVYEYYEDHFDQKHQFTNFQLLVDAGFSNLAFKGVPVVWASACGTRMYFLNTNHIWVYYDPAAYFEMTEWKEPHDQVRTRGAQIYCALQHVTNRRKALGVLHTIDTE